MKYTEAQRSEFEAIAWQMIKWLNDNCHPHHTVVIDSTSAELLEGSIAVSTTAYLHD